MANGKDEFFEREREYAARQEAWDAKARKNGWICKLDGEVLVPEEVGQEYCNRHLARFEKQE
jgi:hypothetical protein